MPARFGKSWAVLLLAVLAGSCQPIRTQVKNINLTADGAKLISLRGAGNEWVDFTVQMNGLATASHQHVRLRLVGLNRLGPDAQWYQLDRYAAALVPMQSDSSSAEVSDLASRGGVWVDLHIPTGTPTGDYHGSCQVLVDGRAIADIPLVVHVYGFSLPDEPSLTIAGEVSSAGLRRLYHGQLPDSVQPLIQRCQENRLQLWFSDLQPMNHWPHETEIWEYPKGDTDRQTAARACAWGAKVEKNDVVLCRGAIADGDENGAWFYSDGDSQVNEPMESVLLKRLRDSEQETEYLVLASRTAGAPMAHTLANLLVRPMLGKVDSADQSLGGPLDSAAFAQGKEFLARIIEGSHFSSTQQKQWNLQLIRWIAEHSRPEMLARSAQWSWDDAKSGQLDLKLGVDIYNPSEMEPTRNFLQWSIVPLGWLPSARNIVNSLPSHRITQASLQGSFDATQLHITTEGSSRLTFISGFDASTSDLTVSVPVASCDRRVGSTMIDGSLSDWSADDTICNTPFIQPIAESTKPNPPATILANFSDTHLFLAFRLEGINSADVSDDCQFFIQPMFADNSLGRKVHLTCKPNSLCQFSGNGSIQYACTVASNIWRGELAVPWSAIIPANTAIPRSLRFNIVQHRGSMNVASWAGPVGTDDALDGILVLRDGPGVLVK